MKTTRHILLITVLLSWLAPFSVAEARRPRGTTMTGVIQSVDHATRWVVFAQDGGPVRRFVYSRFWHNQPEGPPSLLKPGMRVQVTLHNPLIGPDYINRIKAAKNR